MIDQFAEHENLLRKKSWVARHRWRGAPPETWASLCGEVDELRAAEIIAAIAQAPDAPVYLTIESNGGDPLAAFNIFDTLRQHAGPVTVTTSTYCHSAALIVFMAGDVRLASRGAEFLVHGVARQPQQRPTATTLRVEASSLEELDKQIANLICIRARRYPLWRLKADLADETTLSADDAFLRGIVTQLVG